MCMYVWCTMILCDILSFQQKTSTGKEEIFCLTEKRLYFWGLYPWIVNVQPRGVQAASPPAQPTATQSNNSSNQTRVRISLNLTLLGRLQVSFLKTMIVIISDDFSRISDQIRWDLVEIRQDLVQILRDSARSRCYLTKSRPNLVGFGQISTNPTRSRQNRLDINRILTEPAKYHPRQ